jgi:hypothetical protein
MLPVFVFRNFKELRFAASLATARRGIGAYYGWNRQSVEEHKG